MAVIEVTHELETQGSWQFTLQSVDDAGIMRTHLLNLAWPDYDWWSPDGALEPSTVGLAVAECWADNDPSTPLPERFDASVIRRLFRGSDEMVRRRLSGRSLG
ncbi:MAG: hypothetical protein O2800_04925 [Planctomycetota bacterium]|nr:hypothetical protein [Planctomycetota bacterium]